MSYRYNLELMKCFFNGQGPIEFNHRLQKRTQILMDFMIKNNTLRDKVRNLHEIQLANANDNEAQMDIQLQLYSIQCKLNNLYAETEHKLKNI